MASVERQRASSGEQPAAQNETKIPRWRTKLIPWLWAPVLGWYIGGLPEKLLPPLARGGVSLVVAVLFVYDQLHQRNAPLYRKLPPILLFLAVAVSGLAVAVSDPASWDGPTPITVGATALIVCTFLITEDRAVALTTLLGISIFTLGVIEISGTMRDHDLTTASRVVMLILSITIMNVGLLFLAGRRFLFVREFGFSTVGLRQYTLSWVRATAVGIIAVYPAIDVIQHGPLLAGVLLLIAALSWSGVGIVFSFTEAAPRPDAMAGTLLLVTGIAVTGPSLFLVFGDLFFLGTVIAAAGAAMAGGGLSLFKNATNVHLLERVGRQTSPLVEWVKRQVSPAPPRA